MSRVQSPGWNDLRAFGCRSAGGGAGSGCALSLTRATLCDRGRCDGERDEPRLLGRLERARGRAEGGARLLRGHCTEAVTAEVTVVAGRSVESGHWGPSEGAAERVDGTGSYDPCLHGKRACLNGKRALSGNFQHAENWVFLSARSECRQGAQRLWKSVHRGCARTDRLLLDPADRPDRPVGEDLAGRCDLVAMHDVTAELLHHIESEREAGGGAADIAGVDAHLERQVDVEC